MAMSNKSQTKAAWGWNGDMCAVWGVAIVLGDSRKEKERRARVIAAAFPPPLPRYAPTDPVPENFIGLQSEQYPICPDCGKETDLTAAPSGRWWNCECGWEGVQNV
jgi:hypothetical protein